MTTLKEELHIYQPSIALDTLIPRKIRKTVLVLLTVFMLILAAVLGAFVVVASIKAKALSLDVIHTDGRTFLGGLGLLLGPYLILLGFTAYYNTLYFRGIRAITKEDLRDDTGITIEVARVMSRTSDDMTHAFLTSSYGEETIVRTGLPLAVIREFLASPRTFISPDSVPLKAEGFTTLHDVGVYLYKTDEAFRQFLFTHGIIEEHFSGASSWVSRTRAVHKYKKRWWSRDNLGKTQGIGREFSYGVAFELAKYVRDIKSTSALSVTLTDVAYANDIIERLETVLTRSKAANAILIGEPGAGEMDMLIELGRRIRDGRSISSLTGKRLMVFDTNAFIAAHSTKETFEPAFLKLMAGAEKAGSIIIVIENLPAFIQSVIAIGTDVGELMNRFLASPYIQIVATSDGPSFHEQIEMHQAMLRNFEQIPVENPDLSSSIAVLEEATWQYEKKYGYRFTYPAVVRIANDADQYIVDGVMPDKALSLLSDIASEAVHAKLEVITDVFVDTRVSATLGIPVGPIKDAERETLLNLEEELHKRVVGQEDAIHAIAGAMRRARAGIQSKKRPIGSFLFLGSTGVGKTETAKALAALFFGSEEKMVRFDMSEFSGGEGLARLLGSPQHSGALASALREHPYCVLLLDEFEKAATEVHDLFLQVLDEGMFTDARGTRVNARNCIIIATSNAGSSRIWELTQSGKRPQDERDSIVDFIIKERTFRPELINRFDGSIIFASLAEDEQRNIARMMLKDLEKRIHDRGYTLIVDDILLDALMKEGYDPEFGARPMRRAIQDIIEERVATKIIEGSLKPGDSIQLTASDLAE